jgi:hypothetical protein
MRKTALAACLAVLGACGSSVGGGSKRTLNYAPIMVVGVTYDPADGGALVVSDRDCVLPGLGAASVSAIAMGFSSFAGLCDFVKTNSTCATRQNAIVASIVITRAGTSAPGPIGPGHYTLGETSDAGGSTIVSVAFDQSDATCNDVSPVAGATGAVTLTEVSPSVKGAIDVTLLDGKGVSLGSYFGGFDVGTCDTQVDICAMMSGCTTRPCLP